MKRTLYLVTIWCNADPEGYLSRRAKQSNDSAACLWARDWLESSRRTYRRMPNLYNRWSVSSCITPADTRLIAIGDVDHIIVAGNHVWHRDLPRQRS